MTTKPLILRFLTIAGIFAVAITSLLSPTSATALGERESITLSPVSKRYEVRPGEVIHDSVTVLNDGETSYDFTVYGAPYSVADGTYDPNFTSPKPGADAYTWINFTKSTYHIEPRQTIKIPYTLTVKADASPGGHYGAILAEVQPSKDSGQLARKKRVASIIYATVAGDVHLSGKINTASVPWYQSTAPLRAEANVENNGNSDFVASVSYQVSDLLGRQVYTAKNDYVVLPNTTRQLDMLWNNAAWFGIYRVHLGVTVLGNTVNVDKFVLVMPIWLIMLILIALVFGGVYAVSRRSHQTDSAA